MISKLPLWVFEFSAAVSLTLAQMLMTLAVICFVLASYVFWGSPSTPLVICFKIGLIALVLEFLFNQLHNYCLRVLIKREPMLKAEIATWSTKTRISIPKLRKADLSEKDEKPND